jgi:shikimate dehydrogenase
MNDNKGIKKLHGLIGYPLTHSFSHKFFTEKFKKEKITDAAYVNFEIENIGLIEKVLAENKNLVGLNVTIPYKQQIIPYLDEVEESASAVGAVNTIKIKRSGGDLRLIGFNTDVYGFENTLKPLLSVKHKKALILGTGGASKAIKYVLKLLGVEYISASIEELKENEIAYGDIDQLLLKERLIIINATPLGTYPKVDNCPDIPYDALTSDHILYDLVYNPETTLFLKKGIEKGATCKNGLEMLHLQALKSYEIWNNPDL